MFLQFLEVVDQGKGKGFLCSSACKQVANISLVVTAFIHVNKSLLCKFRFSPSHFASSPSKVRQVKSLQSGLKSLRRITTSDLPYTIDFTNTINNIADDQNHIFLSTTNRVYVKQSACSKYMFSEKQIVKKNPVSSACPVICHGLLFQHKTSKINNK